MISLASSATVPVRGGFPMGFPGTLEKVADPPRKQAGIFQYRREGITENEGYIENCDFARFRGSNAVRTAHFCMVNRGRG